MLPLSQLFAGLPHYSIPQERTSLWDKIKGWVWGKQKRWAEPDIISGFVAAHSGRTLRYARPWHINWEVLRAISISQPIVFSIVSTAVRELSGMQWQVVVKRHRPGIVKKAEQINDFLSRPVPGPEGLTFAEWLKKILRDLFIYDAAAIEVVRHPDTGKLVALKPVPGSQIEMAAAPETDDLDPEYPYYRVLRGQVIAKYKPGELIYFKENTRTDSPYGISPLEAAITLVSIIMWADAFQLKQLTVTEVPEGILDLGNVPHDVVERFRMWWLSEVVGQPHKVVIVGGSQAGVRWIPFRSDNRAMQFRQLYDWYVRLLTMCFGVRPQDIGLVEGLNRAVAQELAIGGKRVGLYPRALLLKEIIDHDILEELFDVDLRDMEFKWLDLERRDFEQAARIIRTLGTLYLTVNEARTLLGYDRAVGGLVDALFWQAGAMAFVIGKVPQETEDISELQETEVKTVGAWTGPPQPAPMGTGEGAPTLGGIPLILGAERKSLPTLEKIVTALRVRTQQLPTYWERAAAWEKVCLHQLKKRIPVYRLELRLGGQEVSKGDDYETLMEKLAQAEILNPDIWLRIEEAIAETDARDAIVDVVDNEVKVVLKGRRLERHLTFPLTQHTTSMDDKNPTLND